MNKKHIGLLPEDIFLESFDPEEIPSEPPASLTLTHQDPLLVEQWLAGELFVAYGDISYELLRSAWRLVQLARRHQGGYLEGKELPRSSVAASTGAIAIGGAAFESSLNYEIFEARLTASDHGQHHRERLFELSMKLTPRERLDALASMYETTIDWGQEPFQSLGLLLSVRKHLLHDEPHEYAPGDGHWPSNQLRQLPRVINSPYPTEPTDVSAPLPWHVHVLSPAGAEWAVRTVLSVVGRVESLNPSRRYVQSR